MEDIICTTPQGDKLIVNRFRIDIVDMDTRELVKSFRPGTGFFDAPTSTTIVAIAKCELFKLRNKRLRAVIWKRHPWPTESKEFQRYTIV